MNCNIDEKNWYEPMVGVFPKPTEKYDPSKDNYMDKLSKFDRDGIDRDQNFISNPLIKVSRC